MILCLRSYVSRVCVINVNREKIFTVQWVTCFVVGLVQYKPVELIKSILLLCLYVCVHVRLYIIACRAENCVALNVKYLV